MVPADLKSAIKTAITAIDPGDRDFDAMWLAISTAIITYIQTNAVVVVTGVTTGPSASGPGTIT
jgi:hypothetical protein